MTKEEIQGITDHTSNITTNLLMIMEEFRDNTAKITSEYYRDEVVKVMDETISEVAKSIMEWTQTK